jgi:hypothetical protein
MTIAEAQMQIKAIRDCLVDVEQCKDDVEAFTVALQCMEYFHALRNHLDISYNFAYNFVSKRSKNKILENINKLLQEVGTMK